MAMIDGADGKQYEIPELLSEQQFFEIWARYHGSPNSSPYVNVSDEQREHDLHAVMHELVRAREENALWRHTFAHAMTGIREATETLMQRPMFTIHQGLRKLSDFAEGALSAVTDALKEHYEKELPREWRDGGNNMRVHGRPNYAANSTERRRETRPLHPPMFGGKPQVFHYQGSDNVAEFGQWVEGVTESISRDIGQHVRAGTIEQTGGALIDVGVFNQMARRSQDDQERVNKLVDEMYAYMIDKLGREYPMLVNMLGGLRVEPDGGYAHGYGALKPLADIINDGKIGNNPFGTSLRDILGDF